MSNQFKATLIIARNQTLINMTIEFESPDKYGEAINDAMDNNGEFVIFNTVNGAVVVDRDAFVALLPNESIPK